MGKKLIKKGIRKILRWVDEEKNPNLMEIEGVVNRVAKGKVSIGENVQFLGNNIITGFAPIKIGNNTIIGFNTIIQSKVVDYTIDAIWGKQVNKQILIGKNVIIGAGSIIFPGVIIEDYAVIEAGSIVKENIPQGAIVSGNPAQIISKRDVKKIKSLREGRLSVKLVDHTYKDDMEKPKCEYFFFDTSSIEKTDDIVFYSIFSLKTVNPNIKKKVAWLREPCVRFPKIMDWIKKNHEKFDVILTHDKELLELNGNFEFVPATNCWIQKEKQKIYKKSKEVSIIASYKRETYGHKLRHLIIEKYKEKLDVYGSGYAWLDSKVDGLKDYMYSIVVENGKHDLYFTEKLIDCFRTGTIPIYWGCPSIGDYFDIDGIIMFDNINELNEILNHLNEEHYAKMLPHVKNNFKKAENYLLVEDWLYKNKKNLFIVDSK